VARQGVRNIDFAHRPRARAAGDAALHNPPDDFFGGRIIVQRFSLRRAGLLLLTCLAAPLCAQEKPADYPKRPIRIVVGIAPSALMPDLQTVTEAGVPGFSPRTVLVRSS
jgi:hypothetical protein